MTQTALRAGVERVLGHRAGLFHPFLNLLLDRFACLLHRRLGGFLERLDLRGRGLLQCLDLRRGCFLGGLIGFDALLRHSLCDVLRRFLDVFLLDH